MLMYEKHGKVSGVRIGKGTFLLSFPALLGKINAKVTMWSPERGKDIMNQSCEKEKKMKEENEGWIQGVLS